MNITENQHMDGVRTLLKVRPSGLLEDANYAMTDGNSDDAFTINPSTGEISSSYAFDRETTSEYRLIVEASEGNISKSRCLVVVKILDRQR